MEVLLIAIDGKCGSGKSTLSQIIKEHTDCNVFHMDDYYLPFSKREDNWEQIPGGNIDLKRFREEVLEPAKAGREVLYRPYFCRENRFREEILCEPKSLVIVEGSYSHHPALADLYDLTIFLTCSDEEQIQRLSLREGERLVFYQERWIPMEKRYYEAYGIDQSAQWVYETVSYDVYSRIFNRILNKFK